MDWNLVIFGVLALVVVGSAVAMILSRNSIYSALFLVANFLGVAVLYFILGAPFIALVQVAVYAGSIMVLFLFVIMLLGAERLQRGEPLRGQRLIGAVLGLVFALEIGAFILFRSNLGAVVALPPEGFGDPADIGTELFTQYPLLFLATSIILLAATVGAILLTRGDKPVNK